jgi:hypothetical protein
MASQNPSIAATIFDRVVRNHTEKVADVVHYWGGSRGNRWETPENYTAAVMNPDASGVGSPMRDAILNTVRSSNNVPIPGRND